MSSRSGRRDYGSAHRQARKALLARVVPGVTLCTRCRHPLEAGDQIDLDHSDQTGQYDGFAHHSACRICNSKCNQAAGGQLAAKMAGKESRDKRCVVCGKPFHASQGNDGSLSATCSNMGCVTELRRRRKAGEPDGEPPPATGRAW